MHFFNEGNFVLEKQWRDNVFFLNDRKFIRKMKGKWSGN